MSWERRHSSDFTMDISTKKPSHSVQDHTDFIDMDALRSKISNSEFRLKRQSEENSSSGLFEAGVQWLRNYYDSLRRVTVLILLLFIEDAVQDKLFSCPCKSTELNKLYSAAFLVFPAIVLFVTGMWTLIYLWLNGPLTRYVNLGVVHSPGMPGAFFPPPTSKETAS